MHSSHPNDSTASGSNEIVRLQRMIWGSVLGVIAMSLAGLSSVRRGDWLFFGIAAGFAVAFTVRLVLVGRRLRIRRKKCLTTFH